MNTRRHIDTFTGKLVETPVDLTGDSAKMTVMEEVSIKDEVIELLLSLPKQIEQATLDFKRFEAVHVKNVVELSINAMALRIFDGKNGEKVTAGNDDQRKLAVQYALSNITDQNVVKTLIDFTESEAHLTRLKRDYESALAIAQLLRN